jgi:hypothetical protein
MRSKAGSRRRSPRSLCSQDLQDVCPSSFAESRRLHRAKTTSSIKRAAGVAVNRLAVSPDLRRLLAYMLDPTGNVSSWNAGTERIKGYRSEEISGSISPASTPTRIRPRKCLAKPWTSPQKKAPVARPWKADQIGQWFDGIELASLCSRARQLGRCLRFSRRVPMDRRGDTYEVCRRPAGWRLKESFPCPPSVRTCAGS